MKPVAVFPCSWSLEDLKLIPHIHRPFLPLGKEKKKKKKDFLLLAEDIRAQFLNSFWSEGEQLWNTRVSWLHLYSAKDCPGTQYALERDGVHMCATGAQVACQDYAGSTQGCTGGTPIHTLPPSQTPKSWETFSIKSDVYIIGLVCGLRHWLFIDFLSVTLHWKSQKHEIHKLNYFLLLFDLWWDPVNHSSRNRHVTFPFKKLFSKRKT